MQPAGENARLRLNHKAPAVAKERKRLGRRQRLPDKKIACKGGLVQCRVG